MPNQNKNRFIFFNEVQTFARLKQQWQHMPYQNKFYSSPFFPNGQQNLGLI
jgi:hypothetical protein